MDRRKNIMKITEITEDRISGLPDDLIHKILPPSDLKFVATTSVLSKRWKLIWTTLPFLNFNTNSITFIDKFLSKRNKDAEIYKLDLSFGHVPPTNKVDEFISYGISHKVQFLSVVLFGLGATIKFSTFTSTFVKSLTLNLNFNRFTESECWNLPELTTLHLTHHLKEPCKLPESYLICLSSLETLFLDQFELPESISLPALETLQLQQCTMPTELWDLPALSTLNLDDVFFPDEDTCDFFSALANLRELNLVFRDYIIHDWVIDCPRLEYLNIKASDPRRRRPHGAPHRGKIIVFSRKIRNFCSVGYFPITFEDSELKHVDIKFKAKMGTRLELTNMCNGLGSARTLTLDSQTIMVLSSVGEHYVGSPSPFYNLKYVRIPPDDKESNMCASIKRYILDQSPKANIVTAFPKKMIPPIEAASVAVENAVIEDTISPPTKVLVDSENVHRTVGIDTVEVGVQEEHEVQNSEVHVDSVSNVDALLKGTCNDQVSSFRGNCYSGLWRGYEVDAEFVGLLDQIMSKYPRTFEHLTTRNKKFCKIKLDMLCTSVIDFIKTPLTELNANVIAEYRGVFADLEKLGFNVSWLVNRLNYIEQQHISQPLPELQAIDRHIEEAESELHNLQIHIDNAESKLQDLQTLRSEKMQEFLKPVGTMGTSLVVDYIGYNLLSGP